MSFIDGYRHQLVGYFGYLPVYRPLEDIDGPKQEFSCPRGGLAIGGGSGEHPGLVLRDPAGAVAEFLRETWPERAAEAGWRKAIHHHLRTPSDCLDFSSWDVEDHVRFYTLCTTAVPNPYDPEGTASGFESWLCCSLGEFVFFAMPELARGLIERLDDPARDLVHVYWNNILLLPPGLPLYANGGSAWDARLKPLD